MPEPQQFNCMCQFSPAQCQSTCEKMWACIIEICQSMIIDVNPCVRTACQPYNNDKELQKFYSVRAQLRHNQSVRKQVRVPITESDGLLNPVFKIDFLHRIHQPGGVTLPRIPTTLFFETSKICKIIWLKFLFLVVARPGTFWEGGSRIALGNCWQWGFWICLMLLMLAVHIARIQRSIILILNRRKRHRNRERPIL